MTSPRCMPCNGSSTRASRACPFPRFVFEGMVWLQRYAASAVPDNRPEGLAGLRNRAYAAYLLTRTGMVITPIVSSLRETLDARHAKICATTLPRPISPRCTACSIKTPEAAALMDRAAAVNGRAWRRAIRLLLRRHGARRAAALSPVPHFPERARALEPRTLQSMVAPLTRGQYNTHSAAALLMAFDAYASTVPADALGNFSASESAAGKSAPLALEGRLILRGVYGGDSSRLHVDNATGMSGFYAVTNAGFDRTPPTTELRRRDRNSARISGCQGPTRFHGRQRRGSDRPSAPARHRSGVHSQCRRHRPVARRLRAGAAKRGGRRRRGLRAGRQ